MVRRSLVALALGGLLVAGQGCGFVFEAEDPEPSPEQSALADAGCTALSEQPQPVPCSSAKPHPYQCPDTWTSVDFPEGCGPLLEEAISPGHPWTGLTCCSE